MGKNASFKMIRHLIDNYIKYIPKCCIVSLISIAKYGKDLSFRLICLDSLRELCVKNPKLCMNVMDFKVLIDSILNPQLNDIQFTATHHIVHIGPSEYTKIFTTSLDIQKLTQISIHHNIWSTVRLTAHKYAGFPILL